MSADKRRQLRLQSKFSPGPQQSNDRRRESPVGRDRQKKVKNSSAEDGNESLTQGNREIDEKISDSTGQHLPQGTCNITYQENCQYQLPPLDIPKKAEEIKKQGLKVLSTTEAGESRILYYPSFLDIREAFTLYDSLHQSIPFQQLNVIIRGRTYPQPRKVAWFGPFPYAYSGVLLQPQEMPDNVLHIKRKMEDFLAEQSINVEFNSVLLNLYRTGRDSVAWHSDDELSMGIDPTIASVSLGETRKFEMRRKPTETEYDPPIEYFVQLKNGSLLIMDGVMQNDWQHRVPKEGDVAPRINLTFRKVYKDKKLCKLVK